MGKPDGVLVPLSAALSATLPEAVREHARGWQAPHPFAGLGLVTPHGVAERDLHAHGWRSRGRLDGDQLPACLGCEPGVLSAGARMWSASSAACVAGDGWVRETAVTDLLAQLEPDLRALLERALRQKDVVAVGDLLQTTNADSDPAHTLARVAALRATTSADAAQLAQLLLADEEVGVTPLARSALGSALWDPWRGPWPLDAQLERGLAERVLNERCAVTAEAAPAPVLKALSALSDGKPVDWIPAIFSQVQAALSSPPAADPLPIPPRGWLGFVLADRSSAPAVRRARLRRAPAALKCLAWFPDLAPLDALVQDALQTKKWEPVRERLRELHADDATWTGPELQRAQEVLEATAPRSAAAEGTLLALRAANGEDVREAARGLLERGDPETEPLAFTVLDRVGETPCPLDAGDPVGLAQLCRFYGWRTSGKEPPHAFVELMLTRGPAGVGLSDVAQSVEPLSLARLLGVALAPDHALQLLQPLATGPLPVHRRSDGTWDALVDGQAVVLRPLKGLPNLPAACLATPAGLGETPFASIEVPGLGPVAVCHRVGGLPAGPSAPAWRAVVPALRALHQAGFALGSDPLAALRQTEGGWALAGLDLEASLTEPEAAQRADRARLLAQAQAEFATAPEDAPETLEDLSEVLERTTPGSRALWWTELRDFALDAYAEGEAFTPEELCVRFGSTAFGSAREVVLGLDAELWAAGVGSLARTESGAFALNCERVGGVS